MRVLLFVTIVLAGGGGSAGCVNVSVYVYSCLLPPQPAAVMGCVLLLDDRLNKEAAWNE